MMGMQIARAGALFRLVTLLAPLLFTGFVAADCPSEGCRFTELRGANQRLTDIYEKLLAALPEGEADTLRADQRLWLQRRERYCQTFYASGDEDLWLRFATARPHRADCVMDLINERLTSLAPRLESIESERRAAATAAELTRAAASTLVLNSDVQNVTAHPPQDYEMRAPQFRNSGKWYFEITIDPRLIKPDLETLLLAGVAEGDITRGPSVPLRVTNLHIGFSKTDGVTIVGGGPITVVHDGAVGQFQVSQQIIGIAVDLDAGAVYTRRDGTWVDGEPGGAGGVTIRPHRNYQFNVVSGVLMAKLTATPLLSINFGDEPFVGELPSGYLPANGQLQPTDAPAPTALVPPDELVEGKTQAQWTKAYWTWHRSFDRDSLPTEDQTGARCAEHQDGPVWLLAGVTSRESVERKCSPGANSHILFPLIVASGEQSDNDRAHCLASAEKVSQLMGRVSDIEVTIDGLKVSHPTRWRQHFSCETIPTRDGERLYYSDGYWMMLKPLAPGPHEVHVHARLPSQNIEKNIIYRLDIAR